MRSLMFVLSLILPASWASAEESVGTDSSLSRAEIQARHEVCLRMAFDDEVVTETLVASGRRTEEEVYDKCLTGLYGDPHAIFNSHPEEGERIVNGLRACGGTTPTFDGQMVRYSDWVSRNCDELWLMGLHEF